MPAVSAASSHTAQDSLGYKLQTSADGLFSRFNRSEPVRLEIFASDKCLSSGTLVFVDYGFYDCQERRLQLGSGAGLVQVFRKDLFAEI